MSPFVVLCRRTGLERARKSEVQIIGGLAAAALLDRAGHGVTVHEQRGRQVAEAVLVVDPDKLRHFHESWKRAAEAAPGS